MVKIPYNWVGKKQKYLDVLSLETKKKYRRVIDPFMGSGSLLLNSPLKSELYIGNDIIPLIPRLYMVLREYEVEAENIRKLMHQILDKWNWFGDKKLYYDFREQWNNRYLHQDYNLAFGIETLLLLKMCSNSMVRFNKQGVFNQGYRGCTKYTFFNEKTADRLSQELYDLIEHLRSRRYEFSATTFIDYKHYFNDPNVFIYLDPPYSLEDYHTVSYGFHYDEAIENSLYELLEKARCDFVFFNYLTVQNKRNIKLDKLLRKRRLNIVELSSKVNSGQGRKVLSKDIQEVAIIRRTT